MIASTPEPLLAVSSSTAAVEPVAAQTPANLDSVFDMLIAGGPVMVPLVLCSILAATYAIERAFALRARVLGIDGFEGELLAALKTGGVARGVELCTQRATPAARVVRSALVRWSAPFVEREKAVEEAGLREVRTLGANVKPLMYVAMLAPLLGFLGTIYGLIVAFTTVAVQQGLGRPELLAAGISQALITTAAGLTIAVPSQVAYYWLRSRVERFARRVEELYAKAVEALTLPASEPPPASATPSASATPAPAAGEGASHVPA